MYPIFDRYNMLFFNFDDLNNISKNFKIEYTLELIDFFKKKKSIIFLIISHRKNILIIIIIINSKKKKMNPNFNERKESLYQKNKCWN